ncbi:MAG: hypothetical protein EOM19_00945 [Candidatus Moranbacteria bacterium]|nr:hypothetical protein [Candidatus Moranbacteria bacterium]
MDTIEVTVEELKRLLSENSQGCCFTVEEVFKTLATMGFNSNRSQSVLQFLIDEKKIVIKNAIVFK